MTDLDRNLTISSSGSYGTAGFMSEREARNCCELTKMCIRDSVWDKAKEDRTKEKAIFIDEIWQLIGASSNTMAAEFCLEIFKIIRGYGGAAIAATQDLTDFFALGTGMPRLPTAGWKSTCASRERKFPPEACPSRMRWI